MASRISKAADKYTARATARVSAQLTKLDKTMDQVAKNDPFHKLTKHMLGANTASENFQRRLNAAADTLTDYQKKASDLYANDDQRGQIAGALGGAKDILVSIADKSIDAAKAFSAATGTLRSSAAATPASFKGLVDSFRKVGTQVPQNLNDVAAAVGTLSKETKLTGEPLEKMSVTLLNAARLSGMSGAEAAAAASKAMSAWGLAGDKGIDTLDKFYAASQAGGMGMGDLMKKMGQFGEPMQQFGLKFENAIGLFSKWESEGRTPFEDLAKMKDKLPTGGIAAIAAEMKKAQTAAEAADIATKYFGASVANDLANAMKSGKDGFQQLTTAMNQSGGIISTHSQGLTTFGDQWSILQNRITAALAPIGEAMLPVASVMVSMMEAIAGRSDIVIAAITGMSLALLTLLAPAIWAVAAPFAPIIVAVLAVGAAFAALYYIINDIIPKIAQIIEDAWKAAGPLLSKIGSFLGGGSSSSSAPAAAPGATQLPAAYHGLDYVPYDGMVARLHKGERVMTASENRSFSQGGAASISITGNTFNVRQESDIDAIARALAREIKAAGGLMA